MKMRKKLAALLAAAMIASVMPMTAFAATSNRVTKTVKVGKDTTIEESNAPDLVIKLTDDLLETGKKIYLKLEGAEFATEAGIQYKIDGVDMRVGSKTELAVTIPAGKVKGDEIRVPLVAKITAAEAKVTIDPSGTSVSVGSFVFATTNEAKSLVTVGDAKTFYTGQNNSLPKITIDESYAGAFANVTKNKDKIIEIALDNEDFEFVSGSTSVEYRRGFSGITSGVTAEVDPEDKQLLNVTLTPAAFSGLQQGAIDITPKVKSIVKNPVVGDMNVNISGALVENKDYKVATIAEYGVSLKADKDDYDFFAGNSKEVVFHLNEVVKDSLVRGRDVEFELPEGIYFKTGIVANKGTIEEVKNDDKQVTGFIATLTNTDALAEFKFTANLDIPANYDGDVVLKVSGRAIGETLETVLATVKSAIKVTVEPMTVKVGLKEQIGGKVIIEELEKGALNRGGDIFVKLEKDSGIEVTGADVEVTKGDLKKGDIDVAETTKGAITIGVKRASREASTIELTNVKVRLDRTVPEGAYNVEIGGSAISTLANKDGKGIYGYDNITAKDFIFVGERYTRPVTVFTIGSGVYTLNGETMTMDAAAYIKDGRTMVPVRYLAYALGIDADSIKFNAGIVTIFAEDGKVIQLKNNDKNLVINGMSIPMVAAAEIVEGRTYVPVTEIGGVFGVTGTWDSEAQTATFK